MEKGRKDSGVRLERAWLNGDGGQPQNTRAEVWQAVEEAMTDPDLMVVGASPLLHQEVNFEGLPIVWMGGVPGRVLMYAFDRERSNLRFSSFDAEGIEWVQGFGENPDMERVRKWIRAGHVAVQMWTD